MEVNGQHHAPGSFTLGETTTGTHWIGGWEHHTGGLALPGIEPQPSSPSLYPSSAEIKNAGSIPPLPPYVSHGAMLKYKDNFIFKVKAN
jgi:hypothetical protein